MVLQFGRYQEAFLLLELHATLPQPLVICLKVKPAFLTSFSWLLSFSISSQRLLVSLAVLFKVLGGLCFFINPAFALKCSLHWSEPLLVPELTDKLLFFVFHCVWYVLLSGHIVLFNWNEIFFHVNCSIWKLSLISLLNSLRHIISLIETDCNVEVNYQSSWFLLAIT